MLLRLIRQQKVFQIIKKEFQITKKGVSNY